MSEPQDDCLFCAIGAGSLPAEVVRETEDVLVFKDINPAADVHLLAIPRRAHYENAAELSRADADLTAAVIKEATAAALDAGLEGGYRLLFATGVDGGQTIYHVHLHVLGGEIRSLH